jgi:hypothetical protein
LDESMIFFGLGVVDARGILILATKT